MKYNQEHTFKSYTEVWIPIGYIGHIRKKDNDENIEIVNRYLEGGKWHALNFTVRFIGEESHKVCGYYDLAYLKVRKCE